ncbi:hypothetical protein [Nocardia salmonicida]|uniref:hypothetical protein n=1 Tax=Nocardia salmonicida TaxID=53431 RepID=UPI002E2D62F5|nr:hypothetical protein [Nocardia salmonicida]
MAHQSAYRFSAVTGVAGAIRERLVDQLAAGSGDVAMINRTDRNPAGLASPLRSTFTLVMAVNFSQSVQLTRTLQPGSAAFPAGPATKIPNVVDVTETQSQSNCVANRFMQQGFADVMCLGQGSCISVATVRHLCVRTGLGTGASRSQRRQFCH